MIFGWAAAAQATVTFAGPLQAGEEVLVEVTDSTKEPLIGETVRVVHRPGLSGEREVAVGITDARGRVRWTPESPGVARLRAGDEWQAIRVAPASTPSGVPALLGVLGALGCGALAYGLGLGTGRRAGKR